MTLEQLISDLPEPERLGQIGGCSIGSLRAGHGWSGRERVSRELETVVPDMSPAADLAALLRACASGDRAAFRRLYDREAARLYGIALRLTRSPALAADAVQEALLQVWRNAARFDPARGAPEAWLVTLVRYRALDLVRRTAREVPGLEPPEAEDETPDALAGLIRSAEGAALQRCLEALDPERRRLIVMAFVDGLTHADLANRLGTPLGTVKSWIRRALLSLRRCLEP